MKFSPRGYVEHLKRKKMLAMMKAMQEKIEWEPLPPDAPEPTVFIGGKPWPVSELIQTHPQAKHWLEGKP